MHANEMQLKISVVDTRKGIFKWRGIIVIRNSSVIIAQRHLNRDYSALNARVTCNMKISTPYKDIRVDSTIIPCQSRLSIRLLRRSANDDRRRSIITGRLAGHLFQGEACSKRGTSLTFEIIFKVERSARDPHTLAQHREDTHVHTRNIHNVASTLAYTRYIPRGWLPLGGTRGVTGSRNRSRVVEIEGPLRDSIRSRGMAKVAARGKGLMNYRVAPGSARRCWIKWLRCSERPFEPTNRRTMFDKPFAI